jgi:hypothetical protein
MGVGSMSGRGKPGLCSSRSLSLQRQSPRLKSSISRSDHQFRGVMMESMRVLHSDRTKLTGRGNHQGPTISMSELSVRREG